MFLKGSELDPHDFSRAELGLMCGSQQGRIAVNILKRVFQESESFNNRVSYLKASAFSVALGLPTVEV